MITRDEKMVKAQSILDNAFEMCDFNEQEREAFIAMQWMEQMQRRGACTEFRMKEERQERRDMWLNRVAVAISAITIITSLIIITMSIQRW